MAVLITCKFDADMINNNVAHSSGQHFPHYKSMGAFGAMETRVLIQSVQNRMLSFPHPTDATYKI